ncbi:MAG: hypothetical protein CMN56_14610 [Sneathiella sp.]|uniref:DUF4145 domain-containing protein n=1 Tax=Sneathiella sp. TaxID=1964365 RepID=UPI000C5EE49F|nr:DUF4145 domain-containing protein [Sneathiella sp.]MAZ04362.1 hypothetical protein [Sneathiella sp.]
MNEKFDTIPTIDKLSFACPHCGAYSGQTYYDVFASRITGNQRTPTLPNYEAIEDIKNDFNIDADTRERVTEYLKKLCNGKPLLEKEDRYSNKIVRKVWLSECYSCREVSVWVSDKIIYPSHRIEILPNEDMPDHIKDHFVEAQMIVNNSPKGAAALLRLCIQQLCIELGEKGKNLDTDIASLVKKGLRPATQQALDVVRVVGNEAVHPGVINLNDDRSIAYKLFKLVNLIIDQMISHPKQISEIYDSLPPAKLAAIEHRDKKDKKNS